MITLPEDFPDPESFDAEFRVSDNAGRDWKPYPFVKFAEELLRLYEPPQRARATYRQMERVLEMVKGLGVRSTSELTTDFVKRFIDSQPADQSQNTTYFLVSYLRAACNAAAAEGYLRISPFAIRKHWLRLVAPKGRVVHSREEISRILMQMEEEVSKKAGAAQWRARRLHAMFATFAYTGIRRNEGLHLLCRDVMLDAGILVLVSRKDCRMKTAASAQPVPIPAPLGKILAEWIPHAASAWLFPNWEHTGPWIGGSPGHQPLHRVQTVARRAGVEGVTFQSLRHSWATHAEYWGLSDAQIQRVLRHTNSRTQWHYRHAEANNLREIAGAISFDGPPAKNTAEAEKTPDEAKHIAEIVEAVMRLRAIPNPLRGML